MGKLVHDDADDKGYTWIYYTNLYQVESVSEF